MKYVNVNMAVIQWM